MSTGRHAAPIDAVRNWEVQNEIEDDPFNYALDADECCFHWFLRLGKPLHRTWF